MNTNKKPDYQLPTTNCTKSQVVWKFTNQKELTKSQFIDYIERKVFRTIRKHSMLPKSKNLTLKKSQDLNTQVLKHILEKKFPVRLIETTDHRPPTTETANLSQLAEDIFKKTLAGKFKFKIKHNAPLEALSDKEVELYAKLQKIKGTKRKQDNKIQALFQKFLTKNQDLEINILKAYEQIKRTQFLTIPE